MQYLFKSIVVSGGYLISKMARISGLVKCILHAKCNGQIKLPLLFVVMGKFCP